MHRLTKGGQGRGPEDLEDSAGVFLLVAFLFSCLVVSAFLALSF